MSSSSAKPTNLKEVFFSHAALGKIQGNPTYEDIQKLYRQCKANAKSVPCVLGGGANGHLGLIISPLAYARIAPGTPYTRALHPGVLAPPGDAATGFQITKPELSTTMQSVCSWKPTWSSRPSSNRSMNNPVWEALLLQDGEDELVVY